MSPVSDVELICPHCNVTLPSEWPPSRPGRCPTCRLLIAADRASSAGAPAGEHGGGAAGMLADAARRSGVAGGDPDLIVEAMHSAAAERGVAAARLRMLDYERFSRRRPTAPPLAVVLATFTTWKRARLRAGLRDGAAGGGGAERP